MFQSARKAADVEEEGTFCNELQDKHENEKNFTLRSEADEETCSSSYSVQAEDNRSRDYENDYHQASGTLSTLGVVQENLHLEKILLEELKMIGSSALTRQHEAEKDNFTPSTSIAALLYSPKPYSPPRTEFKSSEEIDVDKHLLLLQKSNSDNATANKGKEELSLHSKTDPTYVNKNRPSSTTADDSKNNKKVSKINISLVNNSPKQQRRGKSAQVEEIFTSNPLFSSKPRPKIKTRRSESEPKRPSTPPQQQHQDKSKEIKDRKRHFESEKDIYDNSELSAEEFVKRVLASDIAKSERQREKVKKKLLALGQSVTRDSYGKSLDEEECNLVSSEVEATSNHQTSLLEGETVKIWEEGATATAAAATTTASEDSFDVENVTRLPSGICRHQEDLNVRKENSFSKREKKTKTFAPRADEKGKVGLPLQKEQSKIKIWEVSGDEVDKNKKSAHLTSNSNSSRLIEVNKSSESKKKGHRQAKKSKSPPGPVVIQKVLCRKSSTFLERYISQDDDGLGDPEEEGEVQDEVFQAEGFNPGKRDSAEDQVLLQVVRDLESSLNQDTPKNFRTPEESPPPLPKLESSKKSEESLTSKDSSLSEDLEDEKVTENGQRKNHLDANSTTIQKQEPHPDQLGNENSELDTQRKKSQVVEEEIVAKKLPNSLSYSETNVKPRKLSKEEEFVLPIVTPANIKVAKKMDVLESISTNLSSGILVPQKISHRHSMSQDSNDSSGSSSGIILLPPTHSRLPPDGHEFPQDFRDPGISNKISLNRKLSNDSNGSSKSKTDVYPDTPAKPKTSNPFVRHDEKSVKSVKDKIALFSNNSCRSHHQSSDNVNKAVQQSNSRVLTRAYTHSDVRFCAIDSTNTHHHRYSIQNKSYKENNFTGESSSNSTKTSPKDPNQNIKSISSADLTSSNVSYRSKIKKYEKSLTNNMSSRRTISSHQGRSQSLLEIGSADMLQHMGSNPNQTLPKRNLDPQRRNTASNIREFVSIPEIQNEIITSARIWRQEYSEAKTLEPDPLFGFSSSEQKENHPSPTDNGNVKKVPKFNAKPPVSRESSNNSMFSANSSLDEEFVLARDTIQEYKYRPPTHLLGQTSPIHCSGDEVKPTKISSNPAAKDSSFETSTPCTKDNPRVLKKNSVEAINRRNILDSCKKSSGMGSSANPRIAPDTTLAPLVKKKTSISDFRAIEAKELNKPNPSSTSPSFASLGKPASRSSSFTIAERKKSFETLASFKSGGHDPQPISTSSARRGSSTYSSQDSLTTPARIFTSSKEAIFEKLEKDLDLSYTHMSSRDTIGEEEEVFVAESRRSSRSEADGGSQVTTPTRNTSTPINDVPSLDRSSSVTPTVEKTATPTRVDNVISNDKVFSSVGDSTNSAASKFARSTSIVSKDSGLPDDKVLTNEDETAWGCYGAETTQKSLIPDLETATNPGFSEIPRKVSTPTGRSIKELTGKFEPNLESSISSVTSSRRSSISSHTDHNSFVSFRVGAWTEKDTTDNTPLYMPEESAEWESFDPAITNFSDSKTSELQRKYSVPSYPPQPLSDLQGSKSVADNILPSRSSSLIESQTSDLKVFSMGNLDGSTGKDHSGSFVSNSTSRGSSQADLVDGTDSVIKSPNVSTRGRSTPSSFVRESSANSSKRDRKNDPNRRCVSVNDIRRAFEKAEQSLSQSMAAHEAGNIKNSTSSSSSGLSAPSHNRMSSLDSTTSDESSIPTPHYYGSVSSLLSGQSSNYREHYGSITSLASSTSLISPQELQGLIDEANQSLEESGTPSHEIMVIVLHREFTAGSIGITLAGGADYESKDITVHKVIPGTLADRDGRIQKGDRVLSINGRSTKGVTHREALTILKAPRAEVVLVLSRSRSVTPAESGSFERSDSYSASYSYINMGSNRPPKILESPLDSKSLLSDLKFVDVPRGPPMTVVLKKEGTGLGFSLEGGKDSPLGDRPLVIKKIFTGGAADKSKVLNVGDEIISVNNTDCTRMSRIEAWNFMKKLSDGTANLVVRQKLETKDQTPELQSKPLPSGLSSVKDPNSEEIEK